MNVSNIFRIVTISAQTALICAYPLLVYLGIAWLTTRSLGLFLLVVLLPLMLIRLRSRQRKQLWALLPMPAAMAVLLLLAIVVNDHRFILALPVLINLTLLAGFVSSLRKGSVPVIERLARMQVDSLSEPEVVYCRGVTVTWLVFFVANAAITLALSLWAPPAWWTLYVGLLAYILMGLLFSIEYVIRKYRFRRYGDRWHDRVFARIFPAAPGAMTMGDTFRPCILIPTYENPSTIREVVEALRAHLEDVIVVDDASGPEGRAVIDALADKGLVRVHRRSTNGGKGAAVVDGLDVAHRLGFSHALQIDADGQHDLKDVPRFLATARENPSALVLGSPVFDGTAPRVRRTARRVSQFWVNLETGGKVIDDPLCGFRVYPVKAALAARPRARRMGHDPEVAVKMYWMGSRVINIPTRVRYPRPEEGGVSHYHLFWDNLEMTWTHTRLCNQMVPRLFFRWHKWGR